jgi:uncharacterized protein YecT (DUF1311 family)
MSAQWRCRTWSYVSVTRFLAVIVFTVVLASVGCSRSASVKHESGGRNVTLPVIANPKPLPCPTDPKAKQSTIGLERCNENNVYRTNATINRTTSEIGETLSDRRAKALFITSEKKWQEYRRAECESEADLYRGGSAQRAVFAKCLYEINREHIDRLEEERRFLVATRK